MENFIFIVVVLVFVVTAVWLDRDTLFPSD